MWIAEVHVHRVRGALSTCTQLHIFMSLLVSTTTSTAYGPQGGAVGTACRCRPDRTAGACRALRGAGCGLRAGAGSPTASGAGAGAGGASLRRVLLDQVAQRQAWSPGPVSASSEVVV